MSAPIGPSEPKRVNKTRQPRKTSSLTKIIMDILEQAERRGADLELWQQRRDDGGGTSQEQITSDAAICAWGARKPVSYARHKINT